jgi:hypothetical protein
MSEFDEDRAELERARKARLEAQSASERADKTLSELHRTSVGIRVVVERNGYVDRFREVIRGGV